MELPVPALPELQHYQGKRDIQHIPYLATVLINFLRLLLTLDRATSSITELH